MNKVLKLSLLVGQISVIILALVMTCLRIGVERLDNYEHFVEDWFLSQGLTVEIGNLSARMDGFSTELFISDLSLKVDDSQSLLDLQSAQLKVSLLQSLFRQQLVMSEVSLSVDSVDLRLNQQANLALFSLNNEQNDAAQKSTWLSSLRGLEKFSLQVKEAVLTHADHSLQTLYNTRIEMSPAKDKGDEQLIELSSNLYNKQLKCLVGQFQIDFAHLVNHSELQGTGYISLNMDDLKRVNSLFKPVVDGEVTLNSWLNFSQGGVDVISQANLSNVNYQSAQSNVLLNAHLESLMSYRNQHISVLLNQQNSQVNQVAVAPSSLIYQANWQDNALSNSALLLSQMNLQDSKALLPLINISEQNKALVKSLNAKGKVDELFVYLEDIEQLDALKFALKADEVSWQSSGEIPSVNQVDLSLVGTTKQITSSIKSQDLIVGIPNLFEDPLIANTLDADLNVYIGDKITTLYLPNIKASRDISPVEARVQLTLEEGNSPYMFVRVHAKDADVKKVNQYYPVHIMDDKVVDWLNVAIEKAHVASADVLYAGRLENQVNFDQHYNGIFLTDLAVENIELKYDPAWPLLKADAAKVLFRNHQLFVASEQGHSEQIEASDIHFNIDDLLNAQGYLALQSKGALEDQWGFLAKTPLYEKIPLISGLSDLSGTTDFTLQTRFALDGVAENTTLAVELNAQDAGFELDPYGVNISEVTTDLSFTEKSFEMKPVSAKWFGQPVNVEGTTLDNNHIQLMMDAEALEAPSLMKALPSEWSQHVNGASAWEFSLTLKPEAQNIPFLNISAASDLQHTHITLPEPFHKQGDKSAKFKLDLSLYRDEVLNVAMNLDDRLKMKSYFALDQNRVYQMLNSSIAIGDAEFPDSRLRGINVNANVEQLALSPWWEMIQSAPESEPSEASSSSLMDQLNSVNLRVDDLNWQSLDIKNVSLNLVKSTGGFSGDIKSSMAQGKLFLPFNQSSDVPIRFDLDTLDLTWLEALDKGEEVIWKTDSIPNLVVNSSRLKVNDIDFKDASVTIESHQKNRFILKDVSLTHEEVTLNASGSWIVDEKTGADKSRLSTKIKGENLGETLLKMGLADTITDGSIDFSSEVFWDKPFASFDLQSVKGKARVLLEDGYLNNVEPGGGRLVGLLSLSALPRRIALDFSDLFKEGLEFDKIKGDFTIGDGSFWTDNLKMSGASSDVKIKGRTGLVDKDYDQVISIIPQVRQTLPVLGSILSGPSTGWALLLFQKLFEKPLDESFTIKYQVTGTWDKPKIDLIEQPEEELSELNGYEKNFLN